MNLPYQNEDQKEPCKECKWLTHELNKEHLCEECCLKNGIEYEYCEWSKRDDL